MQCAGDRNALRPIRVVSFEIFIQEGCLTGGLEPRIVSAVERVCHDVLGPDARPVTVSWTVIAKGHGFRGGKPSTTSLVRSRIPDGCDKATRARFLRAIGDAWCRIVGAAEEEVIVSARDWSWAG